MSIRFANSLTYSDSLFPFNGIESTHSSCSPPSSQSYLGNCQFLAKPKPQSTRPSSSSPNSYSYNIASSTKSFHPFLAQSKPTYRPTKSSRTPSPPNSNSGRSSRSTSPRYSNAVANQPVKTPYSGVLRDSDEPVHRYLDLNEMRARNGGEMTHEEFQADLVFYREHRAIDYKIRDKAVIDLNKKWNAELDKNVLDLHGIYPNQVGQVIEEKVADMKKRNWKNLYVVTGVGNNSLYGIAKLRPTTERYLKNNGYRFKEMRNNRGVLILEIE